MLIGVGYACYVTYWQASADTAVANAATQVAHRPASKVATRSLTSSNSLPANTSESSSSLASHASLDKWFSLLQAYAEENPDWLVRVEAYERSRGRFSDAEYDAYAHYDPPTLEAMLEGGDMLAGQVLAKRAKSAGRQDVARHYWHAAAVLGSERALRAMSSIHFESYQQARHRDDVDIAHQNKLDYFIMQNILARRGDNTPLPEQVVQELDLNLTASEHKLVQERAQNYYQLLLSQRAARGLGEFDPPQDFTPPPLKDWAPLPSSRENNR